MEHIAKKLDTIWNDSKIVAGSLLVCGVALALWAALSPRSPGVSIGLLALIAGL